MTNPDTRPPPADRLKEERVTDRLQDLGVEFTLYRHPAVHSVEHAKKHCNTIPGLHVKNLFVKDKKGRKALIVVEANKRVNLKALAAAAGLGRLSFVSGEQMTALLGVDPGSVTPLAVMNAPASDAVTDEKHYRVLIDDDLWAAETVNMHPLHNRASVALSQAGFRAFLASHGFGPEPSAVFDCLPIPVLDPDDQKG